MPQQHFQEASPAQTQELQTSSEHSPAPAYNDQTSPAAESTKVQKPWERN